jgi:Cys-rich repeat protein
MAVFAVACSPTLRVEDEPRVRRDAGVSDAGAIEDGGEDAGQNVEDGGTEPDGGNEPDAGQSGCRTNVDCQNTPATPVCEAESGQCVECLTDARCPSGFLCSPQFQCVKPEGCSIDSECKEGERCSNRKCIPECQFDSDCVGRPGGNRCDPASRTCVKCWQNNHCLSTQACSLGQCVSATKTCYRDLDCANGQVCAIQPNQSNTAWIGGRCIPPVGPVNHGGACKANKECRSGFCRQPFPGATDGYCIGACDSTYGSADCDSSARCREAGEKVPLLGPDGQAGTADDTSAQAYVCSTKQCTLDKDCANLSADPSRPRVCAPRGDPAMSGTNFLTCMPRAGNVGANQACTKDLDCETDTCLDWQLFTPRYRCFKSCLTAADCTGTGSITGCTKVGDTATGGAIGACGP